MLASWKLVQKMSRIRIRIRKSMLRIRIRNKMSRIHNTAYNIATRFCNRTVQYLPICCVRYCYY